jgi:nitrite reductase/ring-hydroxylating ferredoxin subunit
MGVRSFLKRVINGGAGTRSAAPSATAQPEAVKSVKRVLPDRPDAEGFVAVAPSEAVQPGQPGQYEVHGTTVAVFRAEQKLYAIDNACLHEDGPLGEAAQDGFVVTCPYHDWRYDVRDGKCLTHPERRVGCWHVKERDGFVWIGRARTTSSRDRGGEHDDGLKTV